MLVEQGQRLSWHRIWMRPTSRPGPSLLARRLWSVESQPERFLGSGQQGARGGAPSDDALRERLGHYLGGMFYFEGEWFWGIDRIRLLGDAPDRRKASAAANPCVPEPDTRRHHGPGRAARSCWSIFPSLRSPYTAVGHKRVLDLIDRSGVTVKLRPVMPMMMRGVPAPRAPSNATSSRIPRREARAHRARTVPDASSIPLARRLNAPSRSFRAPWRWMRAWPSSPPTSDGGLGGWGSTSPRKRA